MAGLMESKQPIRRKNTMPPHQLKHTPRERSEDYRFHNLSRGVVAGESKCGEQRLTRQAYTWNPVLRGDFYKHSSDRRMNVEIQMTIEVVKIADQVQMSIDLGANLVFRQGYGEPFFRSRVNARDPVIAVKNLLLANGADQFRLDAVTSLDARIEKMFKFGTTSVAFDFDMFNLFNNATVLGKQYDARLTSYDTIQEIMNPRIARLGVRFFF